MAYPEHGTEHAITDAVSVTQESPSPETGGGGTDTAGTQAHTVAATSADDARSTPTGVTVRFNHRVRELSAEEATAYAQKGLKWEQFRGDYDKLRFLAESAGKSVSQLIEDLRVSERQRELDDLLARGTDPDTAQQLVALRHSQREATFQTEEKREADERQSRRDECNRRLAEEYCALKAAVPDSEPFEQLPDAVIRTALDEGITLFDAYLRHRYFAARQTEDEAARRAASAASSTGSLAGLPDTDARESRDFLAAFEQVFI